MNLFRQINKEVGLLVILPLLFLFSLYFSLFYFNSDLDAETINTIMLNIRLPRFLAALVVGASLAVAGYIFQSVLRNPLADPYILGVSSGSASMVSLYLLLVPTTTLLGMQTASLLGSLLVVFIFFILLKFIPQNNLLIILVGVALSYFFSSIITFVLSIMEGKTLLVMNSWLIGNIEQSNSSDLIFLFVVLLFVLAYLMINYKIIEALKLGSDFSYSSGINAKKQGIIFLVTASFLTAASVAVCGTIGFVGLLVPHLTMLILPRKMYKYKILFISFSGAVFLGFCNSMSIIFNNDYVIPIGVFSSFVGAPFLIFIIFRKYYAKNI